MSRPSRQQVPIDIDAVAAAIGDDSEDRDYFLNRHSGQIVSLNRFGPPAAPGEESEADRVLREWETQPDRYELIPKLTPADQRRDIRDFIDEAPDLDLRMLLEALFLPTGAGTTRRFRDFLDRHPEAQAYWEAFRVERLRARAREWLEQIGIEATPP